MSRPTERNSEESVLMHMPKLPPELFDLIIDFLESSLADLKVCSLVARSWNARCQPYLFRLVHLDIWNLPPAILPIIKRSFISRLEGISKNRLTRFTKEFRIDATSSRVGNRVTPPLAYRILARIPPFINLHTLVINVPWNLRWGPSSRWPSENLGSAVSSLIMRNPDLKVLSLRNPIFASLDDLLATMGFYSLNLEQLMIWNVESLSDEVRKMTVDEIQEEMKAKLASRKPRQVPLTGLYIGYLHSRVQDEILMYPEFIDWHEIKDLNLFWDKYNSTSWPVLLHRCLHSNLSSLILTILYYTDPLIINVQPDQLNSLTFLRLSSESVDVLVSALQQLIPASPWLLKIEVILDWAVPGAKKIHKSRTNSPVARHLDPLLTNWVQSASYRQQYYYKRSVYADIYMQYRKLPLKELQKLFGVLLPSTSRQFQFHFGQCHGEFHWRRCNGHCP
ncbi:hypothetical protein BDP27DRAFT_1023447 [Rhodocollybia butyracea]|uniref:F-box domain-containing protein n=1 Tax=Rhodocollybia butyracea TaxID=206335 RepID=A0A9P5PNB7_9AGAR|nr:hypothetical protein BDP27DRAFT_1023447 [Rhodocollybia butyracea]